MPKFLIYTEKYAPRLQYITNFLIKDICGYAVEFTFNKSYYSNYTGVKINYSSARISEQDYFIKPHDLIFQNNIQKQDIKLERNIAYPFFFPTTTDSSFPFDIFSASFWLVTRYEEYLPSSRDDHDRFTFSSSLAYYGDFLHSPIVQIWTDALIASLQKYFPECIPERKKTFKYQASYDIDMAWSYREKGLFRTVGGFLRDIARLELKSALLRLKVLLFNYPDPFDSFNFLERLHQKYKIYPIYFFLLAKSSKFDKNISPNNQEFIALIQKIHQKNRTGIHPSYYSGENPDILKKEINHLKLITNKPVRSSRQHFLRLSFPETYRQLIQQGIKEDYTMGYAGTIGFRAGVAVPFLWFDLEKNETTSLRIFPFQVMDVTLRHYLQLSPQEAYLKVKKIIEAIRSTGGTFTSLWHNSSFAEADGWTKEWKELYKKIVQEATINIIKNKHDN